MPLVPFIGHHSFTMAACGLFQQARVTFTHFELFSTKIEKADCMQRGSSTLLVTQLQALLLFVFLQERNVLCNK
jgi:hypothetical protein